MDRIKFIIALLACKLYLFGQKLKGKEKSDRIGLLARMICPNFLEYIGKPKTIIAVTGTNGKSTITHLVHDMLVLDNKKIGFNEWNANMITGHIRCLVDCVNIFNKPKKDVAILECDELTTNYTFKVIKPTYIIVTNICRDSIRRNAYPEYIFNKLNEGINSSLTSKVILNADDPISSFLGDKNTNKIYVSLENQNIKDIYDNISKDFSSCNKCFGEIVYDYRNYRHIGKFHCTKCGHSSLSGNLIGQKVDYKNNTIMVNNEKYRLLSNSIFNIYNLLQVITLFKEMGYSYNFISNNLKNIEITKTRENIDIVKNIKIYSRLCKGQNGSSSSTVFENLVKDKDLKQLILVMDEDFSSPKSMETITWLYDTDFELLNNENIKKIIVTGHNILDYVARMKLAGIKDDKIITCEKYLDSINLVDIKNKCSIYVLYDVDQRPTGKKIVEEIKKKILEDNK